MKAQCNTYKNEFFHVKNGMIKGLYFILKIDRIEFNMQSEFDESNSIKRVLEHNMNTLIDSLYTRCFFIMTNFDCSISFNILVENNAYEVFLVVGRTSIYKRLKHLANELNLVMNSFQTIMTTEIKYIFEVLRGQKLNNTLKKLYIFEDIQKIKKSGFFQEKNRNGHVFFQAKDSYITGFKLDFPNYFKTNAKYTEIKESPSINELVYSFFEQKINGRYIFNLKTCKNSLINIKNKSYTFQDDEKKISSNEDNQYLHSTSIKINSCVILNSPDLDDLSRKIGIARGIVQGILKIKVLKLKRPNHINNLIKFSYLDKEDYTIEYKDLLNFFYLPAIISNKQNRNFKFGFDNPPDFIGIDGLINIGTLISAEADGKDFFLSIEDLKKHAFICGSTGSGKTIFTQNLIEEIINKHPEIPLLLIEIKGEYKYLEKQHPDIRVLEPGSNFSLNLFNSIIDPKIHAERVFDIIKSSYNILNANEFSPQMEKILVELIQKTSSNLNPKNRNFTQFFKDAKEYLKEKRGKIPYIESSWIGIENRIRRLTTGPLEKVFNDPSAEINFEDIFNERVIVNLSSVIKFGGTKHDIFFIANLLFKMIWDYNITKGPSTGIRHITIVEDAQYFNKKARQDPNDSSYFEDMALILRGTGEALITISTRPDLSNDILSNCGLIVCFQNRLPEDIKKLQGILHLSGNQSNSLEILPEHLSLVKIMAYPFPFLLKTKTKLKNTKDPALFFNEKKIKEDKAGFLEKKILLSKNEKNKKFSSKSSFYWTQENKENVQTSEQSEIKADFVEKIKLYFILNRNIWNSLQHQSVDEIEKMKTKLNTVKRELLNHFADHKNIKMLIKKEKDKSNKKIIMAFLKEIYRK
ncbi:MAG: ATP-binding protein [Promethearchaeota archaeon]